MPISDATPPVVGGLNVNHLVGVAIGGCLTIIGIIVKHILNKAKSRDERDRKEFREDVKTLIQGAEKHYDIEIAELRKWLSDLNEKFDVAVVKFSRVSVEHNLINCKKRKKRKR